MRHFSDGCGPLKQRPTIQISGWVFLDTVEVIGSIPVAPIRPQIVPADLFTRVIQFTNLKLIWSSWTTYLDNSSPIFSAATRFIGSSLWM